MRLVNFVVAIAKWCDDRWQSYFWNFCRGMLRSMGPIFARKKGPSVRPTVLFDIIRAVVKNGFIARPYHQFWTICARSRPRLCTRKYYPGLISLITQKYSSFPWTAVRITAKIEPRRIKGLPPKGKNRKRKKEREKPIHQATTTVLYISHS